MPPPFENPGYEKAPVLPQRGKDGACKGIIRLCRCCMPLLGNKAGERAYRRSAFRRIGPASEDIRRVLFVAAGAGCRFRSRRRGRSFRFLRLLFRGPGRGPRAVESGLSSRSSVDGPVIAPCRRREVLAPQAWHRLHSEPCPAWGGKRWWQAAGCLPCRRSGGCPGWTGPECAS